MDRQFPALGLGGGKDLFCEVTCLNSGRYQGYCMGFRATPQFLQANKLKVKVKLTL